MLEKLQSNQDFQEFLKQAPKKRTNMRISNLSPQQIKKAIHKKSPRLSPNKLDCKINPITYEQFDYNSDVAPSMLGYNS